MMGHQSWLVIMSKLQLLRGEVSMQMLRPQYFYNKLLMVSCYWFKFETNTKITFLLYQ